jgi:carboxypeptidase C (cathepsin A)
MKRFNLLLLSLFIPLFFFAQNMASLLEAEWSKTQHSLNMNGQKLNYSVTTGYMPMTDDSGKLQAKVFFIAYTKDNIEDASKRPITYTFNGGPGSSSVWLHMGGLGPKRILMSDKGAALPPPYEVVDNPYTWLDKTDLVFIDPMMTGYTRPAEGIDKKDFLGYEEDIRLVGDFIRLFTTKMERWNSPKFLAGESYGTTRAAGLSGYLQDQYGLYLNGVILISAVLDFSTIRDFEYNDVPHPLRLPSFAATSWYHKKTNPKHTNLRIFLDEVEKFAVEEYSVALLKGARLEQSEKEKIMNKLHEYTGLSKTYLEDTNLRLYVGKYNKELLRDQSETVGRLDARFKSSDYNDIGERYEFDPSYNGAIYGPFTMAINDHIRRTLKYKNDLPYEILTGKARPWNYSNVQNRFLNVSETLRQAMNKNPYLKVWIASGYYDLATPYFASEYVVDHMFLKEKLRKNVTMTYYESGHMMYIHKPSLLQLKKDFDSFMESSLNHK